MTVTRSGTIAAHLGERASDSYHQAAVIAPGGQLTYGELYEATRQCAGGLKRRGVESGTRVALMVRPGREMVILAFALIRIGAVPVLVDPGIGWRNVKQCLAHARPEVFIGISVAHLARLALGWGRGNLRLNVVVGRVPFPGAISYVDLLEGPADPREEEAGPETDAAIVFTSGSTGPPKGVVYTQGMFQAQAQLLRDSFEIEAGEVDLATFPLFALYDPALKMTTVFPEMDFTRPGKVDPRCIIDPIRKYGVTHLFGSPALLDRVGRFGRKEGTRLPSVRRVLSAGAPVSSRILERFAGLLEPGVPIHTPYGATEALPVASISHLERERLGEDDSLKGVCVGRPLEGVDLDLIPVSDEPCPVWQEDFGVSPGEVGEIVVRGENVSREYFDNPEANRLAKIRDGDAIRHRMGDLGFRDEEGRLWFCGRKAHRVMTEEGTLLTVPVETYFNRHPGVFRTALVGIGDPPRQVPALCVELEAAHVSAEKAVMEELARMAARKPELKGIKTFLAHPSFPVDVRHNAKIFREKLALWAASKLG